jgi:hypothetical protein
LIFERFWFFWILMFPKCSHWVCKRFSWCSHKFFLTSHWVCKRFSWCSHKFFLTSQWAFKVPKVFLDIFPRTTTHGTFTQQWSPPTHALFEPLCNRGNNIRNMPIHLWQGHFSAAI